jgi:hypothetical protein
MRSPDPRQDLSEADGMTLHSYLLFVMASFVLVLVPGPDMV